MNTITTRVAASLLAAGAALGLSLATAAPALAHDELADYGLEIDNASGDLTAITMTFSDKVLEVGTEIAVVDEDGKNRTDGAPEIQDTTVRQPLSAPLAAGNYSVNWRAVSSDGHPIEGLLAFSVADDGHPEWIPAGDGHDAGTDATPEATTGSEPEHEHSEGHEEGNGGTSNGSVAAIAGGIVIIAAAAGSAIVVSRRRKAKAADAADAESSEDRVDA